MSKKVKNKSGYADEDLKSFARVVFPMLQSYLLSEKGQKEYEEYLKQQLNNKNTTK